MRILLPVALLLLIVFGPGIWVQRVLTRYSTPDNRYSGTGAELARHLLDARGLKHVKVEKTTAGDHYDPTDKAVRLTEEKFDGRSLTAITVAAHEVGHAIQDREGYRPLQIRGTLIRGTRGLEKLGAAILVISPFVGIATHMPQLGIITFIGGFLALATSALVHIITLPTEIDASFGRALPMLDEFQILKDADRPHARKILTAAACTYVAASLMSLLNIARWLVILRR